MSSTPQNEHSWHQVNFKEDEASTQGTHALRNLVQNLHDAQHNPSLRPTVQALIMAHGMVLHTRSPPQEETSPQGSEQARRALEREGQAPSSAPHERCLQRSPTQAT